MNKLNFLYQGDLLSLKQLMSNCQANLGTILFNKIISNNSGPSDLTETGVVEMLTGITRDAKKAGLEWDLVSAKIFTSEYLVSEMFFATSPSKDVEIPVTASPALAEIPQSTGATDRMSELNILYLGKPVTVVQMFDNCEANLGLGLFDSITNKIADPSRWTENLLVSTLAKITEAASKKELNWNYDQVVIGEGRYAISRLFLAVEPALVEIPQFSVTAAFAEIPQFTLTGDIAAEALAQQITRKMSRPYIHPEQETAEHTGGSVNYYKVDIKQPVTEGIQPYTAECLDVALALGMNIPEFNMFKAIWRTAAERTLGKAKAGNNAKYDAEKTKFFADLNLRQYTEM